MENKYYLAVEVKPKNYFPIDLVNLKISNLFNSTKLEEIDAFTQKFTKQELVMAIKEANLLDIIDSMPLVIIYYENKNTRKIDVLTKDNHYDMWYLLTDKYSDKVFLNKIINFLNNKVDFEVISKIKACQNKEEFLNIISSLPYFIQRKLYLYLYE